MGVCDMTMEECGNCKYWDEHDEPDAIDGDCRRYPPKQLSFNIPYNEIGNGDHFGYPVSASCGWCGEFVMTRPKVKYGA